MDHLNAVEIVDMVEGRLPPERAAHPATCAACAALVDRTRDALTTAAGVPVPEPSPLFWEHMSSRVREAIGREPAPGTARWLRPLGVPGWTWATAGALAVALVSAAIWSAAPTPVPAPAQATVDRPAGGPAAPADHDIWSEDTGPDQAWEVVQAVAEDVDWDDTSEAEIAARPHAAERVVPQLSSDERAELARLIDEELRRNGA